MNRRDVLRSAVAAVVLVPLRTAAQQKPMPVIGYLTARSAAADTALRPPFLEGLRQAGFVVGRNVAIEYRFAEGQPDRLPALAAELIALPATLLVAIGAPGSGGEVMCVLFGSRENSKPSSSSSILRIARVRAG